MTPALWIYVIGALVTQLLAPFGERRRGEPWSEAAWWFIFWPVALMWPFCLSDIVADIIDGPYRPKHKVVYW